MQQVSEGMATASELYDSAMISPRDLARRRPVDPSPHRSHHQSERKSAVAMLNARWERSRRAEHHNVACASRVVVASPRSRAKLPAVIPRAPAPPCLAIDRYICVPAYDEVLVRDPVSAATSYNFRSVVYR
jgi:hypothetical protein